MPQRHFDDREKLIEEMNARVMDHTTSPRLRHHLNNIYSLRLEHTQAETSPVQMQPQPRPKSKPEKRAELNNAPAAQSTVTMSTYLYRIHLDTGGYFNPEQEKAALGRVLGNENRTDFRHYPTKRPQAAFMRDGMPSNMG